MRWPSDRGMKEPRPPVFSFRAATRGRSPSPQPRLVHPCPCGRRRELHECCLPLAIQVRNGHDAGLRSWSPVAELRASTALLLWGLLSHRSDDEALLAAHSRAARIFWGTVLQANPIWAAACSADGDYGRELFERLWGKTALATRTWLLGALPPAFRTDSVLGNLALDWLLWDAPWLRGQPAAHWLRRSSFLGRGTQCRRVLASLLKSRAGLYELEHALPGIGLELRDLATGSATIVNTPTPPWERTERVLALRIFRVGTWRIAFGDGLLLPRQTAECVLDSLEVLRSARGAPARPSPGWQRWSKAWLLPLLARHLTTHRAAQWVAPSTPDRYH